jgi:hypothetical protein
VDGGWDVEVETVSELETDGCVCRASVERGYDVMEC